MADKSEQRNRRENRANGADRADRMDGGADSDMPFAMVITDPHREDNPIIYVNKCFERITQYTADFAVGRNCRFLQGEDTDPADVERIREGMRRGEDVSVDILNYRADGSAFRNRLLIAPLFDDAGKVINYLGVQRALSREDEVGEQARRDDPVEQGLRQSVDEGRDEDDTDNRSDAFTSIRDGVQDHLSMMMALARLDDDGEAEGFPSRSLGRRIESLQLLYEELDEAGVVSVHAETVPVGAYLSRVAATLNHLEGRRSIRVNVDCDALELPSAVAARLGLLLSELILNALRHAFVGRRDGLVNVEFKVLTHGRARIVIKDDGIGMRDEVDWPFAQDEGAEDAEERRTGQQVGAKLVRRLLDALGAAIEVGTSEFGTTIEIGMHLDALREPGATPALDHSSNA